MWQFYAWLLACYLLGSLSFGIILTRIIGGDDPRSYGSGNTGATNVVRGAGLMMGLLTLLCDVLKAVLPLWLCKHLGMSFDQIAWLGLSVFVGHCYPCFFGFKGGKGVATALGVLLVLQPSFSLYGALVFLSVFMLYRMVSLASILSAFFVMLAFLYVHHGMGEGVLLMLVMLLIRHHENISRIASGREKRLMASKT